MGTLLAFVTVWCLLTGAGIIVGAKRSRAFERVLAARGFVTSSTASALGDIFHRPGVVVTRVVTGIVGGVPATFVFALRPGTPPPIEGTFVNVNVPIVAVLLGAAQTRASIGCWTDQRAYRFGWRPADAAEVTADGRTLLAWDDFGQDASDFDSCCQALARSWTPRQGSRPLHLVQ